MTYDSIEGNFREGKSKLVAVRGLIQVLERRTVEWRGGETENGLTLSHVEPWVIG